MMMEERRIKMLDEGNERDGAQDDDEFDELLGAFSDDDDLHANDNSESKDELMPNEDRYKENCLNTNKDGYNDVDCYDKDPHCPRCDCDKSILATSGEDYITAKDEDALTCERDDQINVAVNDSAGELPSEFGRERLGKPNAAAFIMSQQQNSRKDIAHCDRIGTKCIEQVSGLNIRNPIIPLIIVEERFRQEDDNVAGARCGFVYKSVKQLTLGSANGSNRIGVAQQQERFRDDLRSLGNWATIGETYT